VAGSSGDLGRGVGVEGTPANRVGARTATGQTQIGAKRVRRVSVKAQTRRNEHRSRNRNVPVSRAGGKEWERTNDFIGSLDMFPHLKRSVSNLRWLLVLQMR
jgi:hypothetical protein